MTTSVVIFFVYFLGHFPCLVREQILYSNFKSIAILKA